MKNGEGGLLQFYLVIIISLVILINEFISYEDFSLAILYCYLKTFNIAIYSIVTLIEGKQPVFFFSYSKKRKMGIERESRFLNQKLLPYLNSLNSARVLGLLFLSHDSRPSGFLITSFLWLTEFRIPECGCAENQSCH